MKISGKSVYWQLFLSSSLFFAVLKTWFLLLLMFVIYVAIALIFTLPNPGQVLHNIFKTIIHAISIDIRNWWQRMTSLFKSKDAIIIVPVEKIKKECAPIAKEFEKPVIGVISFENTLLYQKTYQQFSQATKEILEDPYAIVGYNARENKDALASIMTEIRDVKHCLIVAIGTPAALCLQEAEQHFNYKVPAIFIGVEKPVEMGIITSLESSGNFFTGIVGLQHNYEKQLELLLAVKHKTEKILIPFSYYAPWIEKDMKKISRILKPFCSQVIFLGYGSSEQFEKKIITAVNTRSFDLVLTMRDILSVDKLDALVQVCNNTATPIYSSDKLSLERGVAMAFAENDDPLYGKKAAELGGKILQDGINPSDLPIVQMPLNEKFWINPKVAEKQGLKNAAHINSLLKNGKIYT